MIIQNETEQAFPKQNLDHLIEVYKLISENIDQRLLPYQNQLTQVVDQMQSQLQQIELEEQQIQQKFTEN